MVLFQSLAQRLYLQDTGHDEVRKYGKGVNVSHPAEDRGKS